MRVGLWLEDEGRTLTQITELAATAVRSGYSSVWLSERGGWDPLTVLAAVGAAVPDVGLGTSIVRSYPRHPLTLAAQALSAQAVTGNRLLLGVGPGPGPAVETQYGYSYEAPVRHLREYLSALRPLLRGEPVAYRGEQLTAAGQVAVAGAAAPPVFLSALGPAMLRLTGELADGTLTTWAGPRSIGEHIVPALTDAAKAAGRAVPVVIAGCCVSVTADPDGIRRWVDERYGAAAGLPSYRRQLDRERARTPADTVIAGDEETIARELRRLVDAGAGEVQVIPVGPDADQIRTVEVAAALAR